MINRLPPEVIEQNHREWEETLGLAGPPPAPRNIRPVLWLTDPFRVPFRGRLWEIPPVSFEDGARVLEFNAWVDAEDPARFVTEYRTKHRDIMRLIRRCVRPHWSRWARIRWRLGLMRNPWKTASMQDLGEILGFFWMRRMTSPVRHPSPQDLLGGPRTSSATSMSSN